MNHANESTTVGVAHGNWRAWLTGNTNIVLVALLVLLAAAVMLYITVEGRRLDREAQALYMEQHRVTHTMLAALTTSNTALVTQMKESKIATKEDIEEMTYVLTLSQTKREALKLEMPYSLRKKLFNRP